MFVPPEIIVRATTYCITKKIELLGILGAGKDGTVWRTNRSTALKVHICQASYLIERDAYNRLSQLQVRDVAGFAVPRLIEYDDPLFAIEMTAVTPPYLLDFASAIFDEPPDFIEDQGHTFEDFIRSRFDENTQAVLDLYYELAARTGIYLPDMHSQNVKFG